MTAPWMPPLPEPTTRIPAVHTTQRDKNLYAADKMRQAMADAARAALEQAAKVCQNERFVYSDEEWRIRCELADAIRALARDVQHD